MTDDARLAAEQRARVLIDAQLKAAGWAVQDRAGINLFAVQGVAVREAIMAAGHGRADYLLYIEQAAVGVIEAKPEGKTLSGVEWQSAMYAEGLPPATRLKALTTHGRLPFIFEASGTETHFTNGYDPEPRARQILAFPQPETLARTLRDAATDEENATWRAKVRHLPPLETAPLRKPQIAALHALERSLAEQRFDRSLIQMATGAGKTHTAVTECYRLLRYGGFHNILFLVDRNTLADQALTEFQNFTTPDDGRKFTEMYNVDKLTSAGKLASSHVVISTIQRVHRALQGQDVSADDDPDLDAYIPPKPVDVAYNPDLPPETFDLVIVDEAHRSIYGVWRGVVEYFDAHVVGLTATPGKQTFAFFRQNLVSEYTYPQSVADGVNVDFDVYRISTEITEKGSTIEAGTYVPKVDRRTRVQRIEQLDEDLDYAPSDLDRAVTSTAQIRLVLETFRDKVFTEIFPGRTVVPKTLIFCKDDNHAEEVVTTVREVFGKGNDFAAKITYIATDPKGHLQLFRNSATLRIAVTVDMIATGTDVRPLECVFFMRDVRSAQYFEQMRGRGSRTISPTDFHTVTPDAERKTRFVIVDAVGVTEHPLNEPPLNREPSLSLAQLLQRAANLTVTEDDVATLASRLSALVLQVTPAESAELDRVAGVPLRDLVRGLVDAVDMDVQAQAVTGAADPKAAIETLLLDAIKPFAANPELRQRILELRRAHDRIIDEVSMDVLTTAHGVVDPEKARSVVESWEAYLKENRDQITAIEVIGSARGRRASYVDIKELADRIARPPHNWTPAVLWNAYEALDAAHVRHTPTHTTTDLVSVLRFTLGVDDELVPYAEEVRERYARWLDHQARSGVTFSPVEQWWLDRIVEVVASSAGITVSDLDGAPFTTRGGLDGALRDASKVVGLVDALSAELTA